MSVANDSKFFVVSPNSVNHTILNALHAVRRDREQMEAAGEERMWSSIDHLLECASCCFMDVVNANTPVVHAHVVNAAKYLYGILDKRYDAVVAIVA